MRKKPGLTLIEVLIDMFVIVAVFGALAGSFIVATRTVFTNKIRTAASALANEQVESLRNLPYDSLATLHGTILPQGNIPDQQTLTRSGIKFDLLTTIIYVDDPFDGCAIPQANKYVCTDGSLVNQQDLLPIDYKRVTVEAFRLGESLSLIKLSTNVAAKAAETTSNTGMLLVIVNNALGQPVSEAEVTVTNTDLAPQIMIQGLTNNQGYFFVANLPPDSQNHYHIVATKEGFSSDFTTGRTPQNPNQFQPDVSIYIQQITTQTLAIDYLSNLLVTVQDPSGVPLSGISLVAASKKITQFNPETAKHVYTKITDGNGLASFTDIEWDSYTFSLPSNLTLTTISPYQPVAANPSLTTLVTINATTDPNWPVINSVSPASGTTGSNVDVTIDGANFAGGLSLKLTHLGDSDILANNISVAANQKSLTARFNLNGASLASWDVVLTQNGQTTTQKEGFVVSQ